MDFSKQDDILTISLPGSDLVFTQYLYIKEEVRIALLVSILNKSDDAIFWAYELYYSGFKYELLNLIWKIYYDFFATLNPAYEAYLLKKHKELLLDADETQGQIISSIIQDLLFRPFNADVFVLRNLCDKFEIDIISKIPELCTFLKVSNQIFVDTFFAMLYEKGKGIWEILLNLI